MKVSGWASGEAPAPAQTEFLEVMFENHDKTWVLDTIRNRPSDAPFAYVITPNVDHLVRLQRTRSDLWPAYRNAWVTLCDSRILARLASFSGVQLPVIPGSDLTEALFLRTIDPDDRVAILGGTPEAVALLADRYRLRNVVHYNPPMGFIRDPAETARAVRFLVDARARYSLLAVGSPQQELVAYRVARSGAATGIGLCVGASLDFLTGDQHRAPSAMQQLSLEWLFRLASDPARMWRRYLLDGPSIFSIFDDWRRRRGSPT